jgi:AAA+ superfamily predicted ATPase
MIGSSIVRQYAWNAATHPQLSALVANAVCEWLLNHYEMLGITPTPLLRKAIKRLEALEDEPWHRPRNGRRPRHCNTGEPARVASPNEWRRLIALLEPGAAEEDVIARNLAVLAAEADLQTAECGLLLLLARNGRIAALHALERTVTRAAGRISYGVAALLGLPVDDAHRLILPRGRLAQKGLLRTNPSIHPIHGIAAALQLPDSLYCALIRPHADYGAFMEAVIGIPQPPGLTPAEFAHVAADFTLAADLLAGAARRREAGVNILVYGLAGAGKTTLCRTLAAAAGCRLFAVGETGHDGGEPQRADRLAAVRLSNGLLGGAKDAVLLFEGFDEAVAPDPTPDQTGAWSKVYLNRLLEENVVPTLWTVASLEGIDPAFLRRFTVAVELRLPPVEVRGRMLADMAAQAGLELAGADSRRLSAAIEAPPALFSGAVRAARLAGGGAEAVQRAGTGLLKAMSGRPVRLAPEPAVEFVPELVNSPDGDMTTIARRIAAGGAGAVSLCLYGPPGTGKSAFARHLAARMGIAVTEVRASDLLSPWRGGTEAAIAAAFEEARQGASMLVFDEADSLLRDRRRAQAGWEVSMVNEMLAWMESHPLPFICTTNLSDSLDAAAARRFVFKLQFQALDQDRIPLAFRRFFGCAPPPELGGIAGLTPGDFAVVRRKAAILGVLDEPAALGKMLRDEARAKGCAPASIGFAA